jgi:primosomal protein N' (replication factor Y) (superfamily II helicase)
MFAQILLFSGYKKPLWYKVPSSCSDLQKGSVVTVPLRTQTVHGLVRFVSSQPPLDSGDLKAIIAIDQFPEDARYFEFLTALAQIYYTDSNGFFARMVQFLDQPKREEICVSDEEIECKPFAMPPLTDEQEKVTLFLKPRIEKNIYTPTLLCGLTGSGKTEVYKSLIIHTIGLQKTVLFLLPEVALAIAFVKRLSSELPREIMIVGFHAAASKEEKRSVWSALNSQKPLVIIGVHMPVLVPIGNLGLIIVDEEHELGYQEKRFPKISSKQAALLRASIYSVPILLGSATPAISSLYQVKQRKWHFFQLTKRFGGQLPSVELVELKKERARPHFWISARLHDAIADRLQKKEQSIIFLNRRGYAFFVQCFDCGFIFECNSCSVSLTLHDQNKLKCHYCNAESQLGRDCPRCKKLSASFLKKGIGTQQAVEILQKMFPAARIARADLDTTKLQKQWQATYADFVKGEIDILVGTQTVAKGHHFPNVTLVGILWADMNLHFPLFYATEAALQQLIQVAGRAGRTTQSSLVIIQIVERHEVFEFINEASYLRFYSEEIATRMLAGYPPCRYLIELVLQHKKAEIVSRESQEIAALLLKNIAGSGITLLGPTTPLVARIQNKESRIIYIKASTRAETDFLISCAQKQKLKSALFVTPIF